MPIVATHHSILAGSFGPRDDHDLLEEQAVNSSPQVIEDPFSSDFLITDLTEPESSVALDLSYDWQYLDLEIFGKSSPTIAVGDSADSESPQYVDNYHNDDRLTGLFVTDDSARIPQTLVESNHPPLLDASVEHDGLLVYSGEDKLDYLSQVEAIYLTPYDDTIDFDEPSSTNLWIDGGPGHDTLKIKSSNAPNPDQWRNIEEIEWESEDSASGWTSLYGDNYAITVKEDEPFSIELSGIFPNAEALTSVSILSNPNDTPTEWLQFDVQEPDAHLVEHVLIESIFTDANGNVLSRDDLSVLAEGSLLNVDLALTDTRFDGKGLTGLELDLSWNPLSMDFKNVELSSSFPLFQSEGKVDHTEGLLKSLIGASLPIAGYGSVLGDEFRESFASLQFQINSDAGLPLDFNIIPQDYSTSKSIPLDPDQIYTVGTNPAAIPLLAGLGNQSLVGNHQLALYGTYATGGYWLQHLDLSVENTNDRPVALPVSQLLLNEDSAFSIDLSEYFADSDLVYGDKLNFNIVGNSFSHINEWFTFDQATGVLSGIPDYTEVGDFELSISATDTFGESISQAFQFDVKSVNDRPIANHGELPDLYLSHDQDFSFKTPIGLFYDEEDGSDLSYTIDLIGQGSQESWISINNEKGVISGHTPSGALKTYAAVMTATDSEGLSASSQLKIHLVDELFNRLPSLTNAFPKDQTLLEGESLSFDLNALFFDEDKILLGDELAFQYQGPSWLEYNSETGMLSGTTSNLDVGEHTIILTAQDSKGASAAGTFRINVVNVNQAPELSVPSNQSILLQTDSNYTLDLNTIFSDDDVLHGDWLSYSLLARSSSTDNIPNWLSWNSATGQFSINPQSDDRGVLSLLFTATDRSNVSSSYRLDIGIISDDGLVEVNRALNSQHITTNKLTSIDLRDLFFTLREGTDAQYSYELYQPNIDGQNHLLSDQSADWITLIDRSQDVADTNRLVIEPKLFLANSGQEVSVHDLASFDPGTELKLMVDVSDNRNDVDTSGLLGLDLALEWSGLSLTNSDASEINRALSDKFPLFRTVDLNRVDNNYLRFTGASLPAFRLGEPLGDQGSENLISLDFTLVDPSQPILIDLSIVDEQNGGVGYALADATTDESRIHAIDLSTEPLYELNLDPTNEHQGNYLLKISAEASETISSPDSNHNDADGLFSPVDDSNVKSMQSNANIEDSVHQLLSIFVGDGHNIAPITISPFDNISVRDEAIQILPLNRIFEDLDNPSLSYQIQFKALSSELHDLFVNNVYIRYENGTPELVFNVPHLSEAVSSIATITVSDGSSQTRHTFQFTLHPDSNVVDFQVSPNHPPIFVDDLIGIGDFFSSSNVALLDPEDFVELHVASTLPLEFKLSDSFLQLANLDDQEIIQIQNTISVVNIDHQGSLLSYTIPLTTLSQYLNETNSRFDLNWIEFTVAESENIDANDGEELILEVYSRSRVLDDIGGKLYGYSTSGAKIANASIMSRDHIRFQTPREERYLASLVDSSRLQVSPDISVDHTQTLFAWKKQENSDKVFAGTLNDTSSVVQMTVNGRPPVGGIDDSSRNYLIKDLRVMSLDEQVFANYSLEQGLDDNQQIVDNWDPLSFVVEADSSDLSQIDIDPYRDGTQVEVVINLSDSNLLEGDLNGYRKFVSAESIQRANQLNTPLYDLNQNLIVAPGWYDFMQKLDGSGVPVGDGARFVIEEINGLRVISKIILTLTDNYFGDNDMTIGRIFDPGMPVRIGNSPSSAVVNNLKTNTLPKLAFNALPYSSDISDVDIPSNSYSPQIARATDNTAPSITTIPTFLPSDQALPTITRGLGTYSDLQLPAPINSIDQQGPVYSETYSSLGNFRRNIGQEAETSNGFESLNDLFNSLISFAQKPHVLVGLMLGMVLTPSASAKSAHSILDSGLGRSIQIRRKNLDLIEEWPLTLTSNGDDLVNYTLYLKSGRLFVTRSEHSTLPTSTSSSSAIASQSQVSDLWRVLSQVELPGEMIKRVESAANQLLSESLDVVTTNWCSWLDDLARDCILSSDVRARSGLESLLGHVADVQEIDPSLADATILIQMLDCLSRLDKMPTQ